MCLWVFKHINSKFYKSLLFMVSYKKTFHTHSDFNSSFVFVQLTFLLTINDYNILLKRTKTTHLFIFIYLNYLLFVIEIDSNTRMTFTGKR